MGLECVGMSKLTPLSPSDLSGLKAGSSVLRAVAATSFWGVGDLFTFHPQGDPTGHWVEVENLSTGKRYSMPHPKCFEYTGGELGADGWITAPDGGWASNPVPGMRAFYRYRADGTDHIETDQALPSEKQDWEWFEVDDYDDIIAFRPVQTVRDQDSSAQEADTHRATDEAVLADTIRRNLLGVRPDDQAVVLEDDDWRLILASLER